jgi:hypothetical protein
MYVQGKYAYVAARNGGLRIINISKPKFPIEVGHYDRSCYGEGIFVRDGYAYVAAGDYGLRIIDVSNPKSPLEVGYYDLEEKKEDNRRGVCCIQLCLHNR